jgi:hypothetical protein
MSAIHAHVMRDLDADMAGAINVVEVKPISVGSISFNYFGGGQIKCVGIDVHVF